MSANAETSAPPVSIPKLGFEFKLSTRIPSTIITGVVEDEADIGPRVLIIEAVPGCPELNLI